MWRTFMEDSNKKNKPNDELIEAIKEGDCIGKKHYTEEQERIALERRAAKTADRKPDGSTGPNDYPNIPGVRTLSPQDLELF